MNVKGKESTLYDSQGNGLAESAVKDTKDAVRTILACLVRRFGRDFPGGPNTALACEILRGDAEQMQEGSRRQDSLRAAQGAQVRVSTAAFCGESPPHDPLESRRVWRESKQDGRTESFLVCLIGTMSSTWAQPEACTRSGRSDVARLQNGLVTFSWMLWRRDLGTRPKNAKDARVVLPDVNSPAAMAEAEAVGKTRRLCIDKADIGCRCIEEGKRAQGHSKGCRARLESEIAQTDEGRVRLRTAYLRGLARVSAWAPAAIPLPPIPDDVQDMPMDADDRADGCGGNVEKAQCRSSCSRDG